MILSSDGVPSSKNRGRLVEDRKLLLDHLVQFRRMIEHAGRKAKRCRVQKQDDLGNDLVAKIVPQDPCRA